MIINHPPHPPGSRGFSEIQQHTHSMVKLERVEKKGTLDLQSGFLFQLKIWVSQAQFSDMKTQQRWKICVIKYK